MKYSSINVDFTSPEKKLKEQLQRSGAKDITVRKVFDGTYEVRYTVKCDNPEKDIQSVLSQTGTRDVRATTNGNGARFDYKLDDIVDEREFKRKLQDMLRRKGYRSY